jgi:CubicO group peptidase (beta-lactamase class C family)
MTSTRGALADMMEQGVREGVFPGGVLQVLVGGKTVHRSAHGRTSVLPRGQAVTLATCFDLASLTKVLAATPLVLDLIQEGRLALGDPVHRYLPSCTGEGREAISVAHLLEHSSGLPDWRAYYEEVAAARGGAWLATGKGLHGIRGLVASQAPEAAPGERVLYSDLGFILLDWIIEVVAQKPADVLFQRRIVRRLDLKNLFYIDLKNKNKARAARRGRVFAATERCPWRGRVLSGEVHDDNAFAMGGVSGHAGLFGDAESVSTLATAWLDSYRGRASIFARGLTERFWQRSKVPGSTRAMGFDTPSPRDSSSGSRFGASSVGHTGFTGTSLWIDPDRELVVVLLCNRVHPTRENEAISGFRPRLHDLVVENLFL